MEYVIDSKSRSWLLEIIREYRKQLSVSSEGVRKELWRLDDFSAPCQVLSISITNPRLQYIFVTKDIKRPDLDLKCYGPLLPYELVDFMKEELSDPSMRVELTTEDQEAFRTKSFSDYLEELFVGILHTVRDLVLANLVSNGKPFMGWKVIIPYNGFSWFYYNNPSELDPKALVDEMFVGARQREIEPDSDVGSHANNAHTVEETIPGFSTYLYPPVWIGEAPIFDFNAKIFGVSTMLNPLFLTTYKGKSVAFGKQGILFIGGKNKRECIKIMNEIVGTAILMGYNFDAVRENDVGETTLSIDHRMIRNQVYPTSISRYTQASYEWGGINEEVVKSSTKIGIDQFHKMVKKAEETLQDSESGKLVAFLAQAHAHLSSAEYLESYVMSWLIIERNLKSSLLRVLEERDVSKDRKDKVETWSMDTIIEQLEIMGLIDEDLYEELSTLRKKRNKLNHENYVPRESEALMCYKTAEKLVRAHNRFCETI